MKFTFEAFKVEFKNYCLRYLSSLHAEREAISSFGVFTDQDMSSFFLAYNTQEHINKLVPKDSSPSEVELANLTNIWWLPEWKGSDETFDPKESQRFYLKLEKLAALLPSPLYKESLFNMYCEVLGEIKHSNSLPKHSSDFFVLVQEADNFGLRDSDKLKKTLNELEWLEYVRFNKVFMGLD